MPGETTTYKLSYPTDTDMPDGPSQVKDLAQDVDGAKWLSQSLKPTIGVLSQENENFTLENSYQDLPGLKLEITPTVASKLIVIGVFDLFCKGQSIGTMKLDSEEDDPKIARISLAEGRATVSQFWIVSLTAAKHTIKLRAKKVGESGSSSFYTRMLYALFAS